jgi:hypothetical protein
VRSSARAALNEAGRHPAPEARGGRGISEKAYSYSG